MLGLVITWLLASVSLAGSEAGSRTSDLSASALTRGAESLCRANVTARAGMTARMFCCLGIKHRGAEVR